LCPRYMCTHLAGVTVEPSPQWLQWLLKATGVRPISNVVDLTNFVMMDLGNPLHAFDARFVAEHRIVVRRAEEGEVIRTLDGQDRTCDAEMLLICDGEKPVALAGVMGGETSEIRDDTTEVILESANFLAGSVRRTSTRHHLRSESSARFEKALDPELSELAAKQFCKLMVELIDGCRLVSPLVDVAAPKAADLWISLDPDLVSARLGLEIPLSQIRSVLGRLGFDVQDQSSGLLRVKVPTWRATKDVAIAEDLIEEIGRLHGYLNIPPKAPVVTVQPPRLPYYKLQGRRVRQFLSYGCGMHEVMSYAFTLRPLLERLGADIGGRVELANTISSDMDRMRRYLVPNLFNFAEKNARYRDEYALYETGRVFIPVDGELPDQPNMVGFVDVRQSADPETQFRTLRGIVDGLLADLHAPPVEIVRPTVEQIGMRVWMHPARSALILLDGVEIGYFGLIHPRARKVLNLKHPASFAELNLDVVMAATSPEVKYSPLARFPEIGFDVSFEVDEAVTAGSIESAIRGGLDTDWLRAATLFGNYHLENGKKSVSFHLAFRADDRSLTDDEVHGCVKTMIATVESSLGATLRGG
ncbi:MAG: phenylalanyl-tRNA synthetase beta chain, partial [Myxococcota bacterium]